MHDKIIFGSSLVYQIKDFFINTLIGRYILGGIFGLKQNPFPDISGLVKNKKVLVVACGPGNVNSGPSFADASEIIAFDFSKNFVLACKKNCPDWKVFQGNVQHIPTAGNTFDITLIFSALHHIPVNAKEILAEMARVTREGIIIVEGIVPKQGFVKKLMLLWYAVIDGGVYYYSREELEDIFQNLNLQVKNLSLHGPIRHMMYCFLKIYS